MATYATAAQTQAQYHPANAGSHYASGFPIPGGTHAVEWPDPQEQDWDETETLCGLPTLGMEKHEFPDPTLWPQGMIGRWACSDCLAVVNR